MMFILCVLYIITYHMHYSCMVYIYTCYMCINIYIYIYIHSIVVLIYVLYVLYIMFIINIICHNHTYIYIHRSINNKCTVCQPLWGRSDEQIHHIKITHTKNTWASMRGGQMWELELLFSTYPVYNMVLYYSCSVTPYAICVGYACLPPNSGWSKKTLISRASKGLKWHNQNHQELEIVDSYCDSIIHDLVSVSKNRSRNRESF